MLALHAVGVREFLTLPLTQSTMAEALVRLQHGARQRTPKKQAAPVDLFRRKGGSGVTMIAYQFCGRPGQDKQHSTLLSNFDLSP